MPARFTRDFEGVHVLTDDWPIILIEFPETRVSDAALRDCLFHLEELMKEAKGRFEKTFIITDITWIHEFPPGSQRKYTTEWMSRTLPLQKEASLGGATIARSTILRGFINAIHWIAPPALPSVFVATRAEAFDRAVRAFDAARVPLQADLRAALARR